MICNMTYLKQLVTLTLRDLRSKLTSDLLGTRKHENRSALTRGTRWWQNQHSISNNDEVVDGKLLLLSAGGVGKTPAERGRRGGESGESSVGRRGGGGVLCHPASPLRMVPE